MMQKWSPRVPKLTPKEIKIEALTAQRWVLALRHLSIRFLCFYQLAGTVAARRAADVQDQTYSLISYLLVNICPRVQLCNKINIVLTNIEHQDFGES